MTHMCARCGYLTFDNHRRGPVMCPQCGSHDPTIDTFDEPEHDDPDRDDRDPDDDGGEDAENT